MKKSFLFLAVAGALCSPACNCASSPSGDDGGQDAGPEVTPETFCADLARRQCDFYIRCHSEPSQSFDFREGRGNDQVAASERARCEARLAQSKECLVLAEGLKAGRIRFEPDGYVDCAGALYPADGCARDYRRLLQDICRTLPFLQAAATAGSACALDRECLGSFCSAPDVDTCGSCQPYLDGGAPCTRDSQCDPAGHYCPGSDGTSGACTPYKAAGADCTVNDPEMEECGPGKVCALTNLFPLTFQCITGLQEGERCGRGNFECHRSGRGVVELVCAPVTTDTGTQNRCTSIIAPPGGSCGNGETLPGMPRPPFCPETEWCNAERCEPRRAAGEPCTTADQCVAGTRCVDTGTTQTCEPYQDLGAGCGAPEDCKNLLTCTGQCTPSSSLEDEPCAPRTCVEGYCDTSGSTPVCRPFKPTGATCGGPGECRSDVCSTTCLPACWGEP